MMLDCGTSFLYVVNVINACDCLSYCQIFESILALIQLRKIGRIQRLQPLSRFCVCISNRLVLRVKITALLRVVRKYNILRFFKPDF